MGSYGLYQTLFLKKKKGNTETTWCAFCLSEIRHHTDPITSGLTVVHQSPQITSR